MPRSTISRGAAGVSVNESGDRSSFERGYDYTCLDCGKESLIVVTLKQHEKGEVQCPACGSTKLQQHFSSFIAHTTKKS